MASGSMHDSIHMVWRGEDAKRSCVAMGCPEDELAVTVTAMSALAYTGCQIGASVGAAGGPVGVIIGAGVGFMVGGVYANLKKTTCVIL